MVSCCCWLVWHLPLEASTPAWNVWTATLDWNFNPKIHDKLHHVTPQKIFTCPFPRGPCLGSILNLGAIYSQHQTPSLSSIQKTFTFEGVLESEWGHHEAGIGMRSGVFCSLGKRMKVLDTGYFYQISSWNYPYWFLWRYIGFSWFEAFKSTEKIHGHVDSVVGFSSNSRDSLTTTVRSISAHIAIIHGQSTIFNRKVIFTHVDLWVTNLELFLPQYAGWHEQGKLQGIVLKCFTYLYIYVYIYICIYIYL